MNKERNNFYLILGEWKSILFISVSFENLRISAVLVEEGELQPDALLNSSSFITSAKRFWMSEN